MKLFVLSAMALALAGCEMYESATSTVEKVELSASTHRCIVRYETPGGVDRVEVASAEAGTLLRCSQLRQGDTIRLRVHQNGNVDIDWQNT